MTLSSWRWWLSGEHGLAYRIQTLVFVATLAVVAYFWLVGGDSLRDGGAVQIVKAVSTKGAVTLWVAVLPTLFVMAIGMLVAVFFLHFPRARLWLLPILILVNTPPVVFFIWLFPESRGGWTFLIELAVLTFSSLVLYFYSEFYFRELRLEQRALYLKSYRFSGFAFWSTLREKVFWLWLRSFRPILFQIAGYTLFTDLLLEHHSSDRGLFGWLFSHATRDTLAGSRGFLFALTGAFFAGFLLLIERFVILNLEGRLRGVSAGGHIGRLLTRVDRAGGAAGAEFRQPRLHPLPRASDDKSLRWAQVLYGLLAVWLVTLALTNLSGFPERTLRTIADHVEAAAPGNRPDGKSLEYLWALAGNLEIAVPEMPEGALASGFGLDSGGTQFKRDFGRLIRQLPSFTVGSLRTILFPFLSFGLVVVLLAYATAVVVELERGRRFVMLTVIPEVVETFPLFFPLLLGYSITLIEETKLYWYGGIAIVALPIFYRQSGRMIRELRDMNIIDGERMRGVPDRVIVFRLTWYRFIPVLIAQLAFFFAIAIAIDSSMNFLRSFHFDEYSLTALLGKMQSMAEAVQASPRHHPLSPSIYNALLGQLLVILAQLALAFCLIQQVASNAARKTFRKRSAKSKLSEPAADVLDPNQPFAENDSVVLEVVDLSVHFHGDDRPALRRCSLVLLRGESAVLVGRSGAGKSVFLDAICGLLSGAEVTFARISWNLDGVRKNWHATVPEAYRTYQHEAAPLLAAHGSFFFQDSINQLHPLRSIAGQLHEIGAAKDDIVAILREGKGGVGLLPLIDPDPDRAFAALEWKRPAQLSGGMCQRIVLARGMLKRASLLIADEPMTDIDRSTRRIVQRLLIEKFVRSPKTFLAVTHDLSFLQAAAFDRIYQVAHGTLEASELADWQSSIEKESMHLRRALKARTNGSVKTGAPAPSVLVRVDASASKSAHYCYPGSRKVILEIRDTLQLDTQSHLGIVGESGAGKSTLARLLASLLSGPSFPICYPVDGWPKSSAGNRLYRFLQVVFQDSAGTLNHHEPIENIVNETLRIRGIRDTSSIIEHLFDAVDLAGQGRKRPTELSMGMQRRFAVLRALAGVAIAKEQTEAGVGHDRLVVLDEVTRGLDAVTRARLMSLLLDHELLDALGSVRPTFAIISHDLEFVLETCATILVLFRGRPVELARRTSVEEPFAWRHPYSRHLFDGDNELEKRSSREPDQMLCPFYNYCDLPDKDVGGCSPPPLRIVENQGRTFCASEAVGLLKRRG